MGIENKVVSIGLLEKLFTKDKGRPGIGFLLVIGFCTFFFSTTILAQERRVVRVSREQVNRSVQKGLRYLTERLSRSGEISDDFPVATTALAGLAFLSTGSYSDNGLYSPQILKILRSILNKSKTGFNGIPGYISDKDSKMYGHAYSLLFLTQAHGTFPRRPELVAEIQIAIRKAIAIVEKAQTSLGGWGYEPLDTTDEGTLTAGNLQALQQAHLIGFKVKTETIERAKAYLEHSTQSDGSVNYSYNTPQSTYSLTAAKVVAMQSTGDYGTSEHTRKSLEYLKGIDSSADVLAGFAHYYYLHFNLAQVMWALGSEAWQQYAGMYQGELIKQQFADGSWPSQYGNSYATASSVLILQVSQEYLPMFQR